MSAGTVTAWATLIYRHSNFTRYKGHPPLASTRKRCGFGLNGGGWACAVQFVHVSVSVPFSQPCWHL